MNDQSEPQQWEIDRQARRNRKALFEQWLSEVHARNIVNEIEAYTETIEWAERCLNEFPRYDAESAEQIAEEWNRCNQALVDARLGLSDYVRRARQWLIYNEAYHAQYEQDIRLDKTLPAAAALVAADRERRRKNAEALLRGE